MVSLSQGRFGMSEADITTSLPQAGPDLTTANTIKAIGQFGGDARKGWMQGQLLNQLQETGNMINTINAGPEAIREAVKSGNIDPTNKRFQALAAATSQGKISEQRAAIEAEVLLRQSIAKAPAWADTFRAQAREVLGFDPSSASLNSLFLSGPDTDKTQPLTQKDKDLQQADAMFQGGAVSSIDEGFRLIQRERASKLREEIQGSKIQEGRLDSGRVAVEGANRATAQFNGVMLSALSNMQDGGLANPETYKGAIMSAGDLVKQKIENEMAQSKDYIYSPEDYNHVRARVDEQREAYLTILDSQSLTKLLQNRRDQLSALTETQALAIAPGLAMLRQYPEAVQEHALDMYIQAGGDPRVMQEMMAANPRAAFAANLMIEVDKVAPTISALHERSVAALIQKDLITQEGAQKVASEMALKVVDGSETLDIGAVFTGLKESGLPKTALDMVSKTAARSFVDMSTEDRQVVAQDVQVETARQMSQVQRALQGAQGQGFKLSWGADGFTLVDTQGRGAQAVLGPLAPSGFTSPEAEADFIARNPNMTANMLGVEEALDYMNKSVVPILRDQRWAQQVGFDNGQEWAVDVINKINISSLQQEVDQGGPILESMNMRQQADFRKAWRSGDLQAAVEVLTNANVQGAGVAQAQQVGGFQTGGASTEGVAFSAQPVESDLPAYQGNPMIPGLTREAQAIAQFEGGNHDPDASTWDGKTVGIGIDLETNPRAEEIKAQYGLAGRSNREVAEFFFNNPEASAEVFNQEVALHKEELMTAHPELQDLDDTRQEVMANLAFNIGVPKLTGFKEMMKGLKSGDFTQARRELLTTTDKNGNVRLTKWVKDVKAKRAATMALALQYGRWPTEEEVTKVEAMLQNALDNQ